MMNPAFNPLALAAATLSLGAHATVVGVLLIHPFEEPEEVAHLVSVVTTQVPTFATPPAQTADWGVAKTKKEPKLPRFFPSAKTKPSPKSSIEISLSPVSNAQPRGKPTTPNSIPTGTQVIEQQEIKPEQAAATEHAAKVGSPKIRTQIAITPGNAKPSYPLLARKRGYEGQTVIHVAVSSDGLVASTEIVQSSGYAVLDAAAQDAVNGWRFRPATRDGRPVAGRIDVPIEFQLR